MKSKVCDLKTLRLACGEFQGRKFGSDVQQYVTPEAYVLTEDN